MTENAIQNAVASADLLICQARDSPWWSIAACLIAGALVYITIKRR